MKHSPFHKLQTKQAWLNYLETAHLVAIDLGLERISVVAKRLKVLDLGCPVITVAGTNGKGSCVALTQAILTAAGYRVGTYTSPHLLNYNERIQIDAKPIADNALCEAFACVADSCMQTTLTYFEFGTLAALLSFQSMQLDAVILEVGLGGRLDAVNCIDTDIAVISTVDLDHIQWLGHTRELIAKEKAGIMRAHKPCIWGDFTLPASIDKQAKWQRVALYCQGQQFNYKKQTHYWSWQSQQQNLTHLPLPNIDLQNAATVLQTIELLTNRFDNRFFIDQYAIEKGLKRVFIPGRFQIIERRGLLFILDVAHNPAAARCLARRLVNQPCIGKTHAIIGMLADKDIVNTLAPLVSQIDLFYLATLAVPRGATANQLNHCLMQLDGQFSAQAFASPVCALQEIYKAAGKEDRVLIFGSFHTVSAVYTQLNA